MTSIGYIFVIVSVLTGTISAKFSNSTFPDGFSFGAATSAFQIEGAWNEDSKGETIWDHWVHNNPSIIVDHSNADVASDSYHKYKEDVAMIAELGLNHYKFSISWSRILPTGFNNEFSVKGILYYQNLINELQKHNITPIVTMYHWDLPESIQELGGWLNNEIVDYFKDYAEILFEHFPTVKHWITINEPKQVCVGGYGKASKAPFLKLSGEADYLCAYHVVLAHAAVYNLYKKSFSKSEAIISMALDGAWNIPASKSKADADAAERRRLFDFGIYAHPLMFGDWPQVVVDRVKAKSANFTSSRLPSFTKEQKTSIKGTLDFMALNYYDTKVVADYQTADTSISYDNDVGVNISVKADWSIAADGNTIYPDGLKYYLNWMKKTYKNPIIWISENGIADDHLTTDDFDRIYYLAGYLSAVLDSINKDKVKVIGYTMWSLLDNFEWTEGYSMHYGLYSVNLTDTKKTRIPKKSVEYYKQIIKGRQIPTPPKTTPAPPTTTSTTKEPTSSTSENPTTSTTEKPTSTTKEPNRSTNLHSSGFFVVFATTVIYLLFKF